MKALQHWWEVRKFKRWLEAKWACDPAKARYVGLTAQEAYDKCYDYYDLEWVFAVMHWSALYYLCRRDHSHGVSIYAFKQSIGFPSEAKNDEYLKAGY